MIKTLYVAGKHIERTTTSIQGYDNGDNVGKRDITTQIDLRRKSPGTFALLNSTNLFERREYYTSVWLTTSDILSGNVCVRICTNI